MDKGTEKESRGEGDKDSETVGLRRYTTVKLTPSGMDEHAARVLHMIANTSPASAFTIMCELRKEFNICTGSAYNLFRKLDKADLITYEPREPIKFRRLYMLKSRHVALNLDRIKELPTIITKDWARNIKVKEIYPGVLRWIYTGQRKDGHKPPVLFIMPDGIYENSKNNEYLDLQQRETVSYGVFKILRGYGCLKP